jgi:parallel beta-helix repeat protein
MMRRQIHFVLLISTVLLAMVLPATEPSARADILPTPPGQLRIVAWNIEFLGIRDPLRTQQQLNAIADRILSFDAAVLALQERADVSTAEYIRSQLGPSWKIYPYSDNWNALLYDENKVEMLSVELLNTLNSPPYTPYPSGRPRPVSGVFRPAGTQGTEQFRVIGVHCYGVQIPAEGEWLRAKVVDFLNDPREPNDIILLGDLNGTPGNPPHPQLQYGGHLHLLPKENGDSTHVNGNGIDHFYVTADAKEKIPKESTYVIRPEHYGETPYEFRETYSDHYPIFIDMDFVWSSEWAGRPIPGDGAFGWSSTDLVLRWTSGTKAESHDVYFGANEAAVAAATPSSPEYKGNQTATTYHLNGLEMETTYYWRIDEANDITTWKGNLWSFTTTKGYYVDADAPGANDGTSWLDAFNYLRNALIAAQSGDEIWVAEGVYKPDQDLRYPNGSGRRNATFSLRNAVAIKGGFAGFGQPDPDARDIELYETILSGDLLGNDGPDFANNGDNSYHVVTGSGTNATAVLDGFTITAGNANGPEWAGQDCGGGMYNNNSSPTLTNCVFSQNWTDFWGGGMHNWQSNPTLTNCTFSGNLAEDQGGGMLNNQSSPTLTNCTFSENSAGHGGGGMENFFNSYTTLTNCTFSGNSSGNLGGGLYNNQASPVVTNCIFSENWAAFWGGGMVNFFQSSPTLTNCTFSGNSTGDRGGGMDNFDNSNPKLTNCTFSDNSAVWEGGGIYNSQSSPTLTDCTFSDNSAEWNGGGMFLFWSSPTVTNCTFTGNSAGDAGGGIATAFRSRPTLTNCTFSDNSAWGGGGMNNEQYCSPTLTNCILWGNTAPTGPQIFSFDPSSTTVTYSDVQGAWPGVGNIDADPRFVGAKFGEPPEAPIAHWKLDEGAGTTAYDSAGENDGTLVNGPQWTTGQIDGALSFDGGNDYVEVADSTSLDIVDEITIAAWVYKMTSSGAIAMKKEGNCLQYGFDLYQDRLSFHYRTQCGSGIPYQHTYKSDSGISSNTWHHVAVRYESGDSTSAALYLDGVEIPGSWTPLGDGTGQMASMPSYLTIGRTVTDGGTPQNHFKGMIDDVRIYDSALSAEEIQQFYQMDYHLLPNSPCIDAGDNTAVPAGVTTDLDGNPRFVDQPEIPDTGSGTAPIVDMGAFEADYMKVSMKFTPQALNLSSGGQLVKAHFTLPEEFAVEDVDANTPAVIALLGIESYNLSVLLNDEGLVRVEATFRRSDLCSSITSYDDNIEIIVIGRFTTGQQFYGTDIIKITDRAFEHLALFVSYWLQGDCIEPDWCGGADLNADSVVNFLDFALLDRCCIEVPEE